MKKLRSRRNILRKARDHASLRHGKFIQTKVFIKRNGICKSGQL